MVVLAIGLTLSLGTWLNALDLVASDNNERFAQETNESLELLEERMETYEQVLRGVKGLFLASENIGRNEFKAYTEEINLSQKYPGIIGVAFALHIAADEREQHIANVRTEGFPQYNLSPEGNREQYTAIKFIEPFSGSNLDTFGYDMYSEAVRREAMDRAWSSGELALSGKLSVARDVNRDPIAGVILYLPIYKDEVNKGEHSQTEVNTDNLFGWVSAFLSMDTLVHDIQQSESQIRLELYDGSVTSVESQLYSSTRDFQETSALPFQRIEQIEIAQRTWTIAFSADSAFAQAHDRTDPTIVLSVGGVLSVLMALLVWTLSTSKELAVASKERAEAKAAAANQELVETEFRLKSALSGAKHGVWDWNNLTNSVTFDSKWKSMLGYADDEIKNDFSEWERLLHPDDKERAEAAIADFVSGKTETYNLEHRLKTRDGQWRWIIASGDIVSRDASGQPARTIGTHTDITAQKNLELALIESDQRFRGAFETAAMGMALVGLAGEWLEVNQSLQDMLQYQEEELLTLTFQDITHPDDLSLDLDHLSALTTGKIKNYQMEKRYFRRDGSIIWVYLNVSMVTDSNGNPVHYVSQIEDITDRKELEKQVLHQSTHDDLTGLANRRLLHERVTSTFSISRRYKRPFAIMYIDIDNFKQVNDTHGHEAGDELLKWLAKKLSDCVRTSDTLARQGGDEFVLILAEISEPKDAALVARKMLHTIRENFDNSGARIQVTLSIGIAIYDPQSSDSVEDLLRKADVALYQVKHAGRNDFKLYQAESE